MAQRLSILFFLVIACHSDFSPYAGPGYARADGIDPQTMIIDGFVRLDGELKENSFVDLAFCGRRARTSEQDTLTVSKSWIPCYNHRSARDKREQLKRLE